VPRFLVTAGNTREPIDRVRDWGNVFTGNTGYAIARTLATLGEVHLLTSNRAHLDELAREPAGIRGAPFTSHADLRKLLDETMRAGRYDGIFMTAAVADYTPAGAFEVTLRTRNPDGTETWRVRDVAAGKVKSHYDAVAWLGRRTEKLVDLFRGVWGHRGLLVKFKLEVGVGAEELVRIGDASRVASGADYLVANTLEMTQGVGAGAYLLGEGMREWVPRAELAGRLARLAREWVEARG
jgi:phosphopantothenoylcysteine synthetase/decarboxylase